LLHHHHGELKTDVPDQQYYYYFNVGHGAGCDANDNIVDLTYPHNGRANIIKRAKNILK
jgi:hypothetical protein